MWNYISEAAHEPSMRKNKEGTDVTGFYSSSTVFTNWITATNIIKLKNIWKRGGGNDIVCICTPETEAKPNLFKDEESKKEKQAIKKKN